MASGTSNIITYRAGDSDPLDAVIACHDCDLLQRIDNLSDGDTAICLRCEGVLYRKRRNSVDRTLSFALGGLVFFVIANVYPFMAFSLDGRVQENTLLTGIVELYRNGMVVLALVVLFTSILETATSASSTDWLSKWISSFSICASPIPARSIRRTPIP